jgi:phosphate transport system substrate-binding protein
MAGIAVIVIAVAAPAGAAIASTITASGSTTVAPLFALLAKKYAHLKKGKVNFKLAQGGSDVGVADVAAGRVSIGNSSRDPKSSDPGGLVFNPIAKDAVCLVTNPQNKLANLDQAQAQAIFSGKVRDWSQVAGAGTTGPIDLVTRTGASGTADAFQKLIMGSSTVSSTAAQKASNGLVQQGVQADKNAIGYVSLDFVTGTNPVAYKGVACTLANAKSAQYPAVRQLYMITRGPAQGAVAAYISWVQHNKVANTIIATHWIPLHD